MKPSRRTGRPPRVAGARTSTLTVRVTEAERERIAEAAERAGESVCAWVRWAVNRRVVRG